MDIPGLAQKLDSECKGIRIAGESKDFTIDPILSDLDHARLQIELAKLRADLSVSYCGKTITIRKMQPLR